MKLGENVGSIEHETYLKAKALIESEKSDEDLICELLE
jgi:hypothetical protein